MYRPDPEALPFLGTVAGKLASATPIGGHFERQPRCLVKLTSGEVYLDSELQLDTDGWDGGTGDTTHLPGTSWNYSGGGDRPINANEVPYFVLPKGGWENPFGIHLGDYAAVIYKTKLVFAVFADRGEAFRIGEGSIELLRQLGFERVKPDGTVENRGTDPGVITIVFPGSGQRKQYPNQAALLKAIDDNAHVYFENLGGNIHPPPVVG
jgi:hypothetical protein